MNTEQEQLIVSILKDWLCVSVKQEELYLRGEEAQKATVLFSVVLWNSVHNN